VSGSCSRITGNAVKHLSGSMAGNTSTTRKRVGCGLTCSRRVLVLAVSKCFASRGSRRQQRVCRTPARRASEGTLIESLAGALAIPASVRPT
jgi:hypothetical protein